MFARTAANVSMTLPLSGWTALVSNDATDASDDLTTILWRTADGTEGATISVDMASGAKGAVICWRVTGAMDEAPAISAINTGTTSVNTATSNSVAPTGAPQDTLYITMAGGDGEVGAYTAAPTDYVNLQVANTSTAGGAATNNFCGGASRQITASSSDDAGVFTHAVHTNGWTAFAVALRAAAAATEEIPILVVARR